jgi:hypothetical protein
VGDHDSYSDSQWSCGLVVVVVQHPAEARPADNLALSTLRAGRPRRVPKLDLPKSS